MENEFVTIKVSKELLNSLAEKRSAPVEIQFSGPVPDGTYEMTPWVHRCGSTPRYVHDLLEALLSGEPLNFRRHDVPQDVQDRLTAAVASGQMGTVPVSKEEQ